MDLLGNLIWLIFGGLLSAIGYFIGGLVLCVTIIGIPFGLQCFKIAFLVLSPFGKKVVSNNSGSGCLSILFNILWILTGGLYTAFVHLLFGLLLCFTVVGIPFGLQHFKLAELSLAPFGKEVVNA